ncbi:MAG: galactonate dehydratase [Arcticibacterium sp.]|jgi:galactonate dehydratase
MERSSFIKNSILGIGVLLGGLTYTSGFAATSSFKITKIRYCAALDYNKPFFNQARGIVEIETGGGIGEGGSKDMVEQCAQMIIGEGPFRIEYLWQYMYRTIFYPPGLEKLHALGAIEMSLWDIRGKALNIPVYELMGRATRDYVACYATGFRASKATIPEGQFVDCLKAGLCCLRIGPSGGNSPNEPYDFHQNMQKTIDLYESIDSAVGGQGNWAIDLHTRFGLIDEIKVCTAIKDLQPFFVEDTIRSENQAVYKEVIAMTKVPIAVGGQYRDKWDINELIERRLLDYARVTLLNSRGLTELKKIAALSETQYTGMIPYFTGPLSTASLVYVFGSSSPSRGMMESGGGAPEMPAYFKDDYKLYKEGKLYLNPDPGLGVKFNPKKADFVMEVFERTKFPHPYLKSPDGAIHGW